MPGDVSLVYKGYTGVATPANNLLTVQQHIASAQDFLIGEMDSWGNEGPTGDIRRSADLGIVDRSISGIAIAPDSDVSFVEIEYTLPTQGKTAVATQRQLVSVGRPWIGAIPGPDIVLWAKPYRFERSFGSQGRSNGGLYGDIYHKEGVTGDSDFGTLMGTPFLDPRLAVVLSFGDTALTPAWGGKRDPKKFIVQDFSWEASGDETLMIVIPTFGRQRAHCQFRELRAGPGATIDLRVSRVTGFEGVFGTTNDVLYEQQIAPGAYPATTRIGNDGNTVFDIPLNGVIDWLVFYATAVYSVTPNLKGMVTLHD
jgi:hypothetical protein